MENLIVLCVIIFLVILSAIIAGSKVSFSQLSKEHIQLFNSRQTKKDKKITGLLKKPEQLSATLLISGVLTNCGIVFLWLFFSESVFQITSMTKTQLVLLELISIALIIIILCEFVPRILASNFPDKFCIFSVGSIQIISFIFQPISVSYILANSFLDKIFMKEKPELSISYLSDTIEMSESTSKEDKRILEGIVSYGRTYCVEIMRPRVDMVAFDISTPFDKLLGKINECSYSRIPVYQETLDNLKGILFVKDLLPHFHKKIFNWQALIRPAYFVPESKKINDLLLDFQTKKIHLAIVTDEFGGTSGIVTLEDVLEEIVGEIVGEEDATNSLFKKVNENNYIFEGKTLLIDFYKIIQINDNYFDEIKGDAETLAGMIIEIFGEIPTEGTKYSYKQFLFTVLSSDKRKIKQIQVTKL